MNRLSNINRQVSGLKEVCVVAAGRSPLRAYKGEFAGLTATDLAALTLQGVLLKYNIPAAEVQECFVGNVYSGNLGQSPAKQIAVKAGLNENTVCSSVSKVCASGMLAVTSAMMTIAQGLQDVIAAGGVEVMTHVPYYKQRTGNSELEDGLIKDGLWDARYNVHMGECAERTREEFNVTREQMDQFAAESYRKAQVAWDQGKFYTEVIPIQIPGGPLIERDTLKGANTLFSQLRTVFRKTNGAVTAGNSSPLSDGAAMLILASREKAEEKGWKVLGTLLSHAHAEQNNLKFTTTPHLAVRTAVERAGLSVNDIDFFELNEAFSVVGITNTQLLGVEPEKVNKYGGAVALGHPLGCSGARIVVTLLNVLRQEHGALGVAGICNGGGGASALVLRV